MRDKEQVAELTDRMRGTVDALVPVIDGFAKALPPGEEKVGPLASPPMSRTWRAAVRKENEYFAETVSGETGTNVAAADSRPRSTRSTRPSRRTRSRSDDRGDRRRCSRAHANAHA